MLIAMPGRFADMTLVAWLVVENTDSPLAVALITIVRFIPFLFAGPLIGILIDRVPRVLLLRVAHGLFLASALAMTAAHAFGTVPLLVLYAYAAAGGIAWTIEIPARRAYAARAVGRGSITAAFALEMLVWNLGAILGANVAGAL
ncbi:MAG: MFS transporter, partial [Myxococcales bacterium]|nr:MFS transporter [Myxococcales bacterium]